MPYTDEEILALTRGFGETLVDPSEWIYLCVKIVRGTQPGEPERSFPICWDQFYIHPAERVSDRGILRGLDEEFVVYKVPAQYGEHCEGKAPHRFETLNEEEATERIQEYRIARGGQPGPPASETFARGTPVKKPVRATLRQERQRRRKRRRNRRRLTRGT